MGMIFTFRNNYPIAHVQFSQKPMEFVCIYDAALSNWAKCLPAVVTFIGTFTVLQTHCSPQNHHLLPKDGSSTGATVLPPREPCL